jgi:osmotically-inducible protein OsmY
LVASNEPERVTLGNSLAAPAQLSEQDRDLLFVPSDLLADFRLAAELRRALAMDRSLSLLARRIQIHAVDGVVTLRGEVCSSAERSAIVTTARRLAGDDQVKAWITIKC